MPRQLAALKVKIGTNADGSAKYPSFNSLQSIIDSGLDWAKYIDSKGTGWHFDKCCGHREEDAESPLGMQWGLLLVPEQFATEAAAAFPSVCSRLTEQQCEAFFDHRVAAEEEDELEDEQALQRLERKLRLLKELDGTDESPADYAASLKKIRRQIKRALDPDNRTRGVKRNPRANWARFKATHAVTFKE